jgi:chromosome transmission fidelity protein 4
MAVKVAEFHHLPGFKEKVLQLRDAKEDEDRMELLREKRRRWNKVDAPRQLLVDEQAYSHPKPFQDFAPPPVISRPGLARATPAVEPSRYVTPAPPSDVSWGDPPSTDVSPGGKRKRDEDEMSSSMDFGAPLPKPSMSVLLPPLFVSYDHSAETNPFARKPATQENGRNPFARKSENTTIQKSESFFDKVEDADQPKSKRMLFLDSDFMRLMSIQDHLKLRRRETKRQNNKRAFVNSCTTREKRRSDFPRNRQTPRFSRRLQRFPSPNLPWLSTPTLL